MPNSHTPSDAGAVTTDSVSAAIMAERLRFQAIMQSPEAIGREQTAVKLAVQTSLPAQAVADLLADLPKASGIAFLDAMNREGAVNAATPLGSAPGDDPKAERKAQLSQAAKSYSVVAGYIPAASVKA